jgi:hypothetical protein
MVSLCLQFRGAEDAVSLMASEGDSLVIVPAVISSVGVFWEDFTYYYCNDDQ